MFNAVLLLLLAKPGGGGWTYRDFEPATPQHENLATGIIALAIWWVFYGIFTEPGHIFGHEPYPNVEEFTDEQLGIPPIDDEE
jgi:hypothetical protein